MRGASPICIRLRMRDGCRTGFATPSETFAGGDPENIPDGVANPVRQRFSVSAPSKAWCFLRGASPRQVRSGQPPVPSVASGQDRHTVERPGRSVHRESYRPQGERRSPEAWNSTVKSKKADRDVFNVTEAETKESSVSLRSLLQR
ncbi:Uncharacterized protein dnm_010495 [Desulfonema magnum]|uniref:Uncharacterized protein n=1 Tax=Desulfonema magnum TaxID=45655 RepID=A0A975GKS2_9BACT|nr:Uncharacterized protein dnm_010495 [Desulfonema magnum]